MSIQCSKCGQAVPTHFQSRSVSTCLSCTAIKSNISSHIQPRYQRGETPLCCALCGGDPGQGTSTCPTCLTLLSEVHSMTGQQFLENRDKPWLIKSGGVVLGPLPTNKVEEKLRNKEIGLFDLVQKPFGRWLYVREEEVFKNVVEEVRSRPAGREDTVALTSTDVTEIMEPTFFREDTLSDLRQVHALKETDYRHLPLDEFESSSVSWRRLLLIPLFFILALFVFALVLLPDLGRESPTPISMDGERARRAFERGDYDAAIQGFDKIYKEGVTDQSDVEIYSLLLLYKKRNVEAERVISDFTKRQLGEEQKKKALILGALKYIFARETTNAEEVLIKVLEIDRKNETAVFNLANVYLLKNEPARALDTLETVESPSQEQDLWIFTKAMALSQEILRHKEDQNLKAELDKWLHQDLKGALASPYLSERSLLQAFLLLKSGDVGASQLLIGSLLQQEPEVTENSVEELWLYDLWANWEQLKPYCQQLHEAHADSLGDSLWAYCLIRASELDQAAEVSQAAFLKTPNETTRSILAYAKLRLGKHDETLSLLMDKVLTSPFENWLLARACEEAKNWTCFQQGVDKLLAVDPSSPFALTARVRRTEDKEEKKKWQDLAEEKIFYYRPFRLLAGESGL